MATAVTGMIFRVLTPPAVVAESALRALGTLPRVVSLMSSPVTVLSAMSRP